jgi:FdhD protein
MSDLDPTCESKSVWRWSTDHGMRQIQDDLVSERPLEIQIHGRSMSVTMRTPGHDQELAIGFLIGEGLIAKAADLQGTELHTPNDQDTIVNVIPAPHIDVDFEKFTRHVYATSSCGLCGKTSIDTLNTGFEPVVSDAIVGTDTLLTMAKELRAKQSTFDRTGGLHAAGLFDTAGQLLVLREDVGRHNAVDKILGHALSHDLFPLDQCVMLVSGRSSFEIMQKALAGGIPIVAAVSAPSSLAVEFAEQNNQTLVGFLRENRMNVYSGADRVACD